MTSEIKDYYTPLGIDTLKLAEHLGYTKGTMLRHLLRAGNHETITELDDLKTVRGLLDIRIGELEVKDEGESEAPSEALDASKIFVDSIQLSPLAGANVIGQKVISINTFTLDWDVRVIEEKAGSAGHYRFISIPGESGVTAEYLITNEHDELATPLAEVLNDWGNND